MNYQEYRQSLNQKPAEKVQREFADSREDILSKSLQEVYDAAYQIILGKLYRPCILHITKATTIRFLDLNWFRRLAPDANMRKKRIDAIRLKLLKIAVKVVDFFVFC